MPSAIINGVPHSFPEGLSILQALRSAGIDVPTLCHDDRLVPIGGCRLCVVQLQGSVRPVASCTTPLSEAMEISTHTAELEDHRRTLLKLLARDYPLDSADAAPDQEFHRYLRAYGVLGERCAADAHGETKEDGPQANGCIDDSHPYIHVDMTKCVTCFRCVRICAEVQGQFVWQVWDRGDRTTIRPDSGTTLLASSCVGCGACVDTCPSGALEDKSVRLHGAPSVWTRTTCPYCGTGCEMQVGASAGQVVSIRPEPRAPVSRGHLCVKGRYSFAFSSAADRITAPMLKDAAGKWSTVSWETAITHVAQRFQHMLTMYGPQSIGVLGSARATNEENYLAQKFARYVLGTNNVDCCARVCHAPTAAAMKTMLGTGAATNSFDDIERASTILVAGSNATENHPIVGARIKQAVLRGARLIVIDPRRIELAKWAECHLALRPGTNVLLFNALAATIVEEQLVDLDFVHQRVAEFTEFAEFVRPFAPEAVAERCGVSADLIRTAARIYASSKPSICFHGLGMTEHVQGTEGVMSLVNLAILTGNLGKPGTGINPLRGQNNVQGSAQMGCEPNSLTGSAPIHDHVERFEQIWQKPLPRNGGLNLLQMIDAASSGTFKAMWAIGYDVLLTNADLHTTRAAMRKLECMVVQDMFLNKTAEEFGTVFLPVASPYEKDGTFMNAERRIQRVRKAIEPPGQSKPDWQVICELAKAMGAGAAFEFSSAEQIWNEVREVWPAAAGISYARLENAGLQWPCPAEDHPGTQILHREAFPGGRQVALRRIQPRAPGEATSDEYPFALMTGRTLYHFNAGTMTRRTLNTVLHPHDYLNLSPEDASRLGVVTGDRVEIRSRHGEVVLVARISDEVRQGELFCTFHDPAMLVNRVTGPHRDSIVSTPEYKVTAVQLHKHHA